MAGRVPWQYLENIVALDPSTRRLLLVEDNQDDVILTLRAFKRSGITNPIDVVRDGQEALDYLFFTGPQAHRENTIPPAVILLDLQLPRVSGLDVLRRLRTDPRTHLQPVVIMTSSKEQQGVVRHNDAGHARAAGRYVDL